MKLRTLPAKPPGDVAGLALPLFLDPKRHSRPRGHLEDTEDPRSE